MSFWKALKIISANLIKMFRPSTKIFFSWHCPFNVSPALAICSILPVFSARMPLAIAPTNPVPSSRDPHRPDVSLLYPSHRYRTNTVNSKLLEYGVLFIPSCKQFTVAKPKNIFLQMYNVHSLVELTPSYGKYWILRICDGIPLSEKMIESAKILICKHFPGRILQKRSITIWQHWLINHDQK